VASGIWPFQVYDDALKVGLIQGLFSFRGAEERGTAAEIVDSAGHTLGVVANALDEAVTDERALKARDAEMVSDVASGLLQIGGRDQIFGRGLWRDAGPPRAYQAVSIACFQAQGPARLQKLGGLQACKRSPYADLYARCSGKAGAARPARS
jgi:hypothetical protein